MSLLTPTGLALRLSRLQNLGRRQGPRLFCVGTGKSGTHSIARLFEDRKRSVHEGDRAAAITAALNFMDGRIDREQLALFVRTRHTRLGRPDVDSSTLNYFFLDVLMAEFSDAKFVLTIRDCYSWLDSLLNHTLDRPSPLWDRMRDVRFGHHIFHHAEEEQTLKARGLYTLDGYLSYWARHNADVLQQIPPDRLLVVRTHEIQEKAPEIARFAGLPLHSINPTKAHAFKAVQRHNLLSAVPVAFLESKVDRHCRKLMERFFPEIRRVQDVLPQVTQNAVGR